MEMRDVVMVYVAIASCIFLCVCALLMFYCCYIEREPDSPAEQDIPQLRVDRIVPLTDYTSIVVMQEYEDEETTSFDRSDDFDGGIL